MPSFVRIDLFDRLACQPGQVRLGTLGPKDLQSATDILAIDDQETLTFAFTRVDKSTGGVRPIVATLAARTIATVAWSDGTFDERRVSLIEDGQGVGGAITVTCNPMILDLAEGADSATGKGFVSAMVACLRQFSVGLVNQTAMNVWDNYIIPNCPSWVSRGTIDPTTVIPAVTWDRLTPQALALQVRDQLRKMNVTCEIQLRRNGTTDYKLDLVTQIGSSASVPLFHPRTNLASLKRKIDTTTQATRLFITGETDPTGVPGIPGRSRWVVTNVDSVNKKLTLADPNGGAGPIGMDGQWATPTTAYLLRALTGRTFPVQASSAVAQTATLLDLSTIAVGESFEFRLTEPLTNARTIANPNTRFAISTISGGGDYIIPVSSPITVDGTYTDWYARVWTLSSGGTIVATLRITGSIASTDHVLCAVGGTGVTTAHFVEFIQLDGAGEIPSYLEHATAVQPSPTGYGVKAGDLAVGTAVGVTQIGGNAWMRTWSNPSNPPDGYRLIGGVGSSSRNANPAFTRYGGFSYLVDFDSSSGGRQFISPRFDPALCVGNSRLSVRMQVYFTTFSGTHEFTMEVYALDQSGTQFGPQLGVEQVYPTNFIGTPPPNATAASTGVWVTMEITGIDLPLEGAPYGLGIYLSDLLCGSAQCVAYVDTAEVYGFLVNPANIYEFGDSTVLHQTGNRQLQMNGPPPVAYELTVLDLERSDPATWSRNALTKGGAVRAFNAEIGIDQTIRLLRLQRNLLSPEQSTVGLASLPTLLTQLV